MSLDTFHPAVRSWFERRFPNGPSIPQQQGWPAIRSGRHTLIAAPTGSGKTLAAFLSAIDELIRLGLDPSAGGPGALPNETRVLYVSPLKALSNDIEKNLAEPLAGIRVELERMGLPDVDIQTAVRTGDTPAAERQAHLKRPPHLFVTTPESLFILLTTRRGRQMLQTVRTVIVDEIHAVADDKRGSHLALTLERLESLVTNGSVGDVYQQNGKRHYVEAEDQPTRPAGHPPIRIGLSATQRPIEDVARFLVGARRTKPLDCQIIDVGHVRELDLQIEVPNSPVEALASNEMWTEVYDRLAELIEQNRTTLVFVNTRRLAERVVHHLSERIGEEWITSHHGSLSKERRLDAEERLKTGQLKALVATASLELGIDIGTVDLVCQIGSPHTIAALVQRVGRSGRKMGAVAHGRLFALSRDELVECAALVRSVNEELLDRLIIPELPLDILAQQIVAAAACRDWNAHELFELVRGAHPFRNLSRETFDTIVLMLAEGYAVQRGPRAAYIHYDEINGRIRGRRGARLAAVTSGGAIPDNSDYQVILDPEGVMVGSINEDFAIESLPGDIFQLGNTSWEILKIETGRVRVADAKGQPPNIPFWLGEAPARTDELSCEVSRLRTDVEERLAAGPGVAARWLTEDVNIPPEAARQIEEYLAATKTVLTVIPSRETLVLERFFDEAGGMQLVIHSPFGGRINRAWGLALRKRFCRGFDFELQTAATEDSIVLSLGPTHSFPLDDVFGYLETGTARELLVQALLAAPMFQTRWRWNACRSLAVLRMQSGKKVPAQLLRMRAEDMLVAAFPQAAACLENVVGDIEVPDHPIVQQTVEDCLIEAMDIDGLEALLARIENGDLKLVARDVPEPSPMAHEILNARPYAFLDEAPAEERRTLAVLTRRSLDFRTADELGTLDPEAIDRVREEAWPEPENEDEVHDVLAWLGLVTDDEAEPWSTLLDQLEADHRATRFIATRAERAFWVAAERLPEVAALYGQIELRQPVEAPERLRERSWGRAEALTALLRGRVEALGPVTAIGIAHALGLDRELVDGALIALEGEGLVLRGHFTPDAAGASEPPLEWCHRRLLARIHRYTIDRLRSEIEPVTPAQFMRFLFSWQGLTATDKPADPPGVLAVLEQLQGFEAPAATWETDLLTSRVRDYDPAWLDQLCLSGEIAWGRLIPPTPTMDDDGQVKPRTGPVRNSPLALLRRDQLTEFLWLAPTPPVAEEELSHYGRTVLAALRDGGAAFEQDLQSRTDLLPTQIERGLGELVAWGLVTADGITGLRALITPESERHRRRRRYAGRPPKFSAGTSTGRWSLFRPIASQQNSNGSAAEVETHREAMVEFFARQLLARYGVLVRRLLDREPPLAPWRDLLRVLRKLEMRGEIRGGRFVQGVSGEQFALPEAVDAVRAIRRREPEGELVVVSGGDPLNLAGIITPGERVAALPSNRVLYRDGVPIAVKEGKRRRLLSETVGTGERQAIDTMLTTGRLVH
jgi:ATP-dependent Lhr-like helicase